jgi:ABC-2 type transport system permease protein
MTNSFIRIARLYFFQAWFSYRSLFGWSTPFNYIASKLGFPFFSMLMFIFIGKFVGLNDPGYIVIGNILLLPALNGIGGVSMTIGGERQFGAMSYLLGSPAPRAPLFLGRSFFHILDGFAQLLVALPLAMLLFGIRFSGISLPLLLLCMVILSITTNGLGFLMGTITLLSRDGWMITSTLIVGLYLLIGVNFPVDLLPPVLKAISYGLPMTRGIMAARMVLDGAGWSSVSALIVGEVLIGLVYMVIGYFVFIAVEKASMKNGMLDSI